MKKVLGTYANPNQHWVGDGFPVRTLFDYGSLGPRISPFLLLDFAGPAYFQPTVDAARRRPASAPWFRDGNHRLRGRGRAPRLDRQGRRHRTRRRAVDDRRRRHPA